MDKLTGSLMRLAAAFPRDHVPESTITLYRSKLERLDLDLIASVIETAIESSAKFPTIAELREAYRNEVHRIPTYEPPALPIGRAPMPESLKAQIEEMERKMHSAFDARAAELEEA